MIESLTGDAGVRESLEQLRPSGGAVEALARVSWSVLTEPGDGVAGALIEELGCLLYTSPSPRDRQKSRMPSSA